MHRHACERVHQLVGPEFRPELAARLEAGIDEAQKSMWQTRGIGVYRIKRPRLVQDEWLQWLKTPGPYVDDGSLTWYIDASQIDDDFDLTRRFGYGIIAVSKTGRLEAAALGAPPAYVGTISQAEAHALAMVLENTVSRGQVVTD